MSTSYTGGCLCGALRYEVGAEPIFMSHCGCRDCQHRSGTGHGSYLTFNREDVAETGDTARWDSAGNSGTLKHHRFCPTCGCPVSLTFLAAPGLFVVHAASLDDPNRFIPQAITYAEHAPLWDDLDRTLKRFEKGPI